MNDEVVERVQEHVLNGMGLLVLHSAHMSNIFLELIGTSCGLKWHEAAESERLWVTDPAHPITDGVPESYEVPEAEMYGEHFDVLHPDALVFTSWFEGGEVFRSGCCYHRGEGRIFYFRPGHETYPIYHQEEIHQVLVNGVEWAAPDENGPEIYRGNHNPIEDIDTSDNRTVH